VTARRVVVEARGENWTALALDQRAPGIGKAEFEDVLGEVDGECGGDRCFGLNMRGGLLS